MIRKFFVLICCFHFFVQLSAHPMLVEAKQSKANISGNFQSAKVEKQLRDSIFFQVIDEQNKPIANQKVFLTISQVPKNAKNYSIADTILFTDSNGICGTTLKLGNKKGEYLLTASILSESSHNTLVYTFEAQSKLWLLFMMIGLAGGLMIFMYGMNIMSTGMQKSAGDKMRSILSTLTHNNFVGLGVGTLVTGIIQSSSATSVMLVSFVNSGLMRFRQTLSILLGSAVGTTITVQLIAFKLTDYSLGFIAIGGLFYMFAKKQQIKHIGESVFGFGLLFFGMEIMSNSMAPMRSSQMVMELFASLNNPIIGILAGAIFTAIVQSSSASIGIFIILASQGMLSYESSIALVLGANLGTPVTALLASINTSNDAKRVALALLSYKVFLVTISIWFIPIIAKYFAMGSEMHHISETLPRATANAHTFFNISLAIVLFPFLSKIEKLILYIKPLKTNELPTQKTRYIDYNLVNQPAIAIQLAKEETMRLSRKIQLSLELIIAPFLENNPKYLEDLYQHRIQAKEIRDEIRKYLLQINTSAKSKIRTEELFAISHTLTQLSHINDALTKILHRRAEKWIERNYIFSEMEKSEILKFHASTIQLYNNAITLFNEYTASDVLRIKKQAKEQAKKAMEIEKSHYRRLLLLEKTELTNTKTYLELINMFKTIGEYAATLVNIEFED